MDNEMNTVEKKILQELERYNKINNYIMEQEAPELAPPPPTGDAPPPPGETTPPAAGAPPAPAGAPTEPAVVDTATDPDVEKIDNKGESEEKGDETEELDITDLVTAQKDISQKQEDYFEQLFSQLENLESKLGEMDALMDKVNSLENKLEKYRPRTPQEKLELRSLDSGPYNQKLSDFFIDKEPQLEKSGKNEYILTSDEVENYSPSEIRGTFNEPIEKNLGI